MQAILTKYYGPTNFRGSRIVAKCERGQLTMPYRHELNSDENHVEAARLLCEKFAAEDVVRYLTPKNENFWLTEKVSGCLPNNAGWVHVFVKP